jgi:hypothetical protein
MARIGVAGLEFVEEGTRPRGALFVDLDARGEGLVPTLDHLRKVPPSVTHSLKTVVVRWPVTETSDQAGLEAVRGRLADLVRKNLHLNARVLILETPASTKPSLSDEEGNVVVDDELVSELCQSELATYLLRGRALWRPRDYHYRLPSGNHSATFVRLADAIVSERDALCMASWLVQHVPETGDLAVVLDSPSLVPIMLGLRVLAKPGAGQIFSTVFSEYPRTLVDVEVPIRQAQRSGARVLALLSVNSTGSLLDKLHQSFKKLDVDGRIVVAVNKTRARADLHVETTTIWLPLEEPVESSESECRFCREAERSRIVQISPWNFDALVLPKPELFTPDVKGAASNRGFWELCDRLDSVGIGLPIDVGANRPASTNMNIKVDWKLIAEAAQPEDLALVSAKVASSMKGAFSDVVAEAQTEQPNRLAPVSNLHPFDVLLIQQDEHSRCGIGFFDAIASRLPGAPIVLPVDRELNHAEWPTELQTAVDGAKTIGLVALGVVSGTSIHRTLAQVHDRRRQTGLYDVAALIVHGRPESDRSWTTFANPFGPLFFHGWLTFVAESQSLLTDEKALLSSVEDDADDEEGNEFLTNRRDLCTTGAASSSPFIWGTETNTEVLRIRPGSWYGERLRPVATLAAVGSAIQRSRTDPKFAGRGAPDWRQCDLVSVCRSYYDAVIIGAVLRWLTPSECWWGLTQRDALRAIEEVVGQFTGSDDLCVLLSELMIAASMGKVPMSAMEPVKAKAAILADSSELSSRQRGALKIGLRLMKENE